MFSVEPGERVCLIGRNGAGKSTTLKLITGQIEPDDGKIERPGVLRWTLLDQTLAEESHHTAREFVALGMDLQLERIARFQRLTDTAQKDKTTLREIEDLQREIEAGGGWAIDVQIDRIVSELGLPGERRMDELSGGWRRRVALAQALVSNPDLLLLDEPTNHLDITTIEWLEDKVRHYRGAVLFVTHDRSFVEKVATRIVDIDRGELRSWPGGYTELSRAEGQERDRGGHPQCPLRQEARPRGGLGSQGRQGSPDAQRRTRARARRAARGPFCTDEAAAHGAHSDQRVRGRLRTQGHRSAQRFACVRRHTFARSVLAARDARRPARHHREQRRRQEHSAAHSARRARARLGNSKARHESDDRLFRPTTPRPGPDQDRRGDHRRRPRVRNDTR